MKTPLDAVVIGSKDENSAAVMGSEKICGAGGGELIAKGTPEESAQTPESFTGEILKKLL